MDSSLDDYILGHISPEPPNLAKLSRDVNLRLLYPRMCSGHLQGCLLTMLTAMISPRRALEIGTYAGYSALCIAEGLPEGGHLDTVEIDDEMEDFIRARFRESPYGGRITLHIGDSARIIPALEGYYDLAYIDADKRTYSETFLSVLHLMRPGGWIIADNTLWDGKVADPAATDPQTEGIRRFNDMLASIPGITYVILPLRDGLTLIHLGENIITSDDINHCNE